MPSPEESDHPMALYALTGALRSLSLASPAVTARLPTLLPAAQVISLPGLLPPGLSRPGELVSMA